MFREAAGDVAEQLMPEEEIKNLTTTNCCTLRNTEFKCYELLPIIALFSALIGINSWIHSTQIAHAIVDDLICVVWVTQCSSLVETIEL